MQTVQTCLAELERLSSAKTGESLRVVLLRITDLFLITSEQQSESDSSVFGNVMGRIAPDVSEDARAELSQRIAERPNTPRNLALLLANDTIRVARPVLEHTVTLKPQDLVAIARSHGHEHRLMIAKRLELASSVTDVLAAEGNEQVLKTLALNHGAKFSPAGFETLVNRASNSLEINEALSERRDFPTDLLANVRENVTQTFDREFSGAGGGLSLSEIAGEISTEAEDVRIDASKANYFGGIDYLHRCGNLSKETVVRLIKSNDKESTAYAISKLLGLPPQMVDSVLFRGSAFAIAIIAKAVDITGDELNHLVELCKSEGIYTPEFLSDARKLYMALDKQSAHRILRFLKVRIAVESS